MLTSKQKVFLRSLAQTERPVLQIGKEVITENVVTAVNNAFHNRELIKISILKTAGDDIKEIAFDLARLTRSELVQIIGRQVVLYKRAKQPGIILP